MTTATLFLGLLGLSSFLEDPACPPVGTPTNPTDPSDCGTYATGSACWDLAQALPLCEDAPDKTACAVALSHFYFADTHAYGLARRWADFCDGDDPSGSEAYCDGIANACDQVTVPAIDPACGPICMFPNAQAVAPAMALDECIGAAGCGDAGCDAPLDFVTTVWLCLDFVGFGP